MKAVAHPNFELLVDFYHLASEQEDPKIMVEAKDHLRHLHMANPQGRVFPLTWDEFDYAPFFATLRSDRLHRAHQRRGLEPGRAGAGAPIDRAAAEGIRRRAERAGRGALTRSCRDVIGWLYMRSKSAFATA